MTLFLPLEASAPFPQFPAFLVPSPAPNVHVKKVVKALLKARRIAVVCGAGISVQAGIPDFRSSEGLFQTLKKDNPTLTSGRDLFDASVFNSEVTTSLFCQMIAQLSELSQAATPTIFHNLLRTLDDRGRLLRVYTQNIDALESKSGLTFGVPDSEGKRSRLRSAKGKAEPSLTEDAAPAPIVDSPPISGRLPSPPCETPRCIPLHGTLQLMHCQICTHSFPLRNHLADLSSGHPPFCPECTALEATRQLVGKRSRGVGKLRPSVVLYNEMHKDGEEVGDVVRRDLIGSSKGKGRAGADLLLVVGTSLRVPGTKRIVREFSKAVHSRGCCSNAGNDPSTLTANTSASASSSTMGLVTPTPSPRRSPADDDEPPVRTVYLNLDFPVPTREWEGVFDVWIRGDAQAFAQLVYEEIEQEKRAKEAAVERKRRREEIAEERERKKQRNGELEHAGKTNSGKKRKGAPGSASRPSSTKKSKNAPVTPISPSKIGRPGKILATSNLKTKPKMKAKTKGRADNVLPTFTHDKEHTNSNVRLTIRIPPRVAPAAPLTPPPSKRARLIPEVVITTPPRLIKTPRTPPTPSHPDSPLTPEPSPPPRLRQTPRTSRRDPSPRKKVEAALATCPVGWNSGDELSDLTDEDDEGDSSLPESFVRTVQYGLRSAPG
ncbi:DHS-like NAD/FAD-binding domain-containing protein [Sparassis latifolia]